MTATLLKSDRMSLEDVYRILEYTEGMQERLFILNEESKAGFVFDSEAYGKAGGVVDVLSNDSHPFLKFHIGEDEYDISYESVSQAFKLIGLPVGYAEKTPLHMVVPHLDYWFKHKGGEHKILVKDGRVVSFCRPGTAVYSTKRLLDSMLGSVVLPENASVVNFYHDIYETHFTLLDDTISEKLGDGSTLIAGIQFQTSLVGLKPLSLSAFVLRSMERSTMGEVELFEGGAMSTALPALNWDRTNDKRKLGLAPEEAELVGNCYTFTENSVEFIVSHIQEEFARLKTLSKMTLDNHAAPFLDDIIKKYKLPPRIYQPVMQEFQHSESSRSALELWMSFGHVGLKDLELTPRLKRMVFQTAGEIARHPAMCNACHRSMPTFDDV